MPIYAYKCAACGHARDVLQKMSDAPLTDCPVCGAPQFQKQVTAAGFQLKGSGWYVTDFRGGNGGTTAPAVADAGGETAANPAATPAPADPAKASPAPASTPPPAPSSSS
jgi:putative FmdB family regulatory protein